MEKEKIPGTLIIWPGVAEELVGTKAWYIRDGYFKNVDACIFTHVSSDFNCSYGDNGGNGLVVIQDTSQIGSGGGGYFNSNNQGLAGTKWNNTYSYLTTGNYNSFIGDGAGFTSTTCSYNTFIGSAAGERNNTDFNTFIGWAAGQSTGIGTGFTNTGNIYDGNDIPHLIARETVSVVLSVSVIELL